MSKDTVQQKIFLPRKIIVKQKKKDQVSPFKDWSFRLNVASYGFVNRLKNCLKQVNIDI